MNDSIHGNGPGMQAMSIAAVRRCLHDLPDRVQDEPVFVTKAGRPVLVILSLDQYEGLWETIEFLDDQASAKRLQVGQEKAKAIGQVRHEEASVAFRS